MENIDFLFEVCFETCNKVGGIYTVVSSKAMLMKEKFPGFAIIGPYYKGKSESEFKEKSVPENFKEIFEELKEEGIICHFGAWKIDGEPDTILIDFEGYKGVLDHLKIRYWEEFKVDSMGSGWDFFEPMIWSTAAGKIIEKYQQKNSDKVVLGHFHEWISGFGLLLLKLANSPAKTVFTTHATMLGRSMSGSGKNLYAVLNDIQPEDEAKNHGVINKFSTEKACAINADAFTTVSEITGIEAEKVLGRKPDVLVLNGLDLREFPSEDGLIELKRNSRNKLINFAEHFLGKEFKNKDDVKILFTSGRYEFRNKGIDIFVKSLEKLNEELESENVVAFFFVPNGWKNIYPEFENWENKEIKKMDNNYLTTHELESPDNDSILNAIKESNLINQDDANVKVIVVPIYLGKEDGLFNMDYYDITAGCDLSIFSSWYEPWGYTPPESLAIGVPTISSDQAGFGRFVNSLDMPDKTCAKIISRYMKDNDDDSIHELKESIKEMIKFDRIEVIKKCREISSTMDWREFIKFYEQTYDIALGK